MKPVKRFRLAIEGTVGDRVPVAPMVNVPHASRVLGVKPWEYVSDNRLYVEGQLKALKLYKYDWIFNHQPIQGVTREERKGMHIEGEYMVLPTELGTTLYIPLEGGPAVKKPAIKSYDEIDRLKEIDLDKPERWEPLKELLRRTKGEVYICSKVPAPFHYSAEWIVGMEKFMLDMLTRPKDVHRLLDIMADIAIEIGKRQIDLGTHGIMMEDPSAASQVISPEHYREFAYPYEKKVVKTLEKYGGEVIIHICGDTTPILEDLAKTGAKVLSVDESVNLADAKRRVGNKVALFGNVSVDTLFQGSEEDIKRNVDRCISTAGKEGYIVSSSCGLHASTPIKNLKTMVDHAKKVGR